MTLPFRPPAVPLVTHDPYFSAWSFSDELTETEVRHWTGTNYGLCGLARIDGQTYRCIGTFPREVEAMSQTSLEVTATRTTYAFEAAGIRLALTFLSPLLPHDLDVMSRPVTYITWEARATDGRAHDVSIYLHVQGEWVVNTADQAVVSSRYRQPGMDVLRMGSARQPILETSGDNLRIDWGHVYLAVPHEAPGTAALLEADPARRAFWRNRDAPRRGPDRRAPPRP